MPNNVVNELIVRGPRKDIAAFIARVDKSPEEPFDFQSLVPMPPPDDPGLQKRGGCMPGWYEWQITHWGCKWGAYDASPWTWDTDSKDTGAASASLRYHTAWSPATEFMKTASALYPALTFEVWYADPTMPFTGIESMCNGQVVYAKEFEWDGTEGVAARQRLGVYFEWPSSDEEDESTSSTRRGLTTQVSK